MIKSLIPLAFWEREGIQPLSLSATNFSRTPPGNEPRPANATLKTL